MRREPLKPCPFCGGKAQIIEVTEPSNVGGYVVQCGACEASTRVWFPIKDRVEGILTDAWNKRKADV
jgi:Lar family restriction alleviation protein